jgi:hypothetical protein
MNAKASGQRSPMSDDHKAALAEGRDQGRAVRNYLEALDANRPKRGRKRTPDSIKKRLVAIDEKLAAADALQRLHLLQERSDLSTELESMDAPGVDMDAVEEAFVKAARAYGERKGVSYATWRAAGVDAAILKKAGISRGS